MIALLRAIHAEQLKLRKTLALWLCLLAPLLVALLGFAMIWTTPAILSQTAMGTPGTVAIKTLIGMWAGMMLPLFVTLESALLAGLEHGNNQWKHLLALALPRGAHYAAKLIALIALVALSTSVLCLLILAGGWLLTLPVDSTLAGRPALGNLVGCAAAVLLAALPMIAAQFFIAIRWRSFSLAMAVGITATMIAMFIPHEGIFGQWFPWSMPVLAVNGSPQELGQVLVAGIIAFCLLVALGVWDFTRRERT